MKTVLSVEEVNNKVLKWSLYFCVIYIAAALIIGIMASSQAIIFDGIVSLVGVGCTYLSILAMKFIKKKDSWNYPFGKAVFEPFIVIVQYCIILFVCFNNITSSIDIILAGGHEIDFVSGVLYGIFAAAFTLGVVFYLNRIAKQNPSAISEVEIRQWMFSAMRAGAILVGFTIALVLNKTALAQFTPFIDPVLSLLITLAFAKAAIVSIIACIKELLTAKPSVDIMEMIVDRVEETNRNYVFKDKVFRIGKAGGQVIIEIDYLIEKDCELDSICKQDELREDLIQSLGEVPYEKWINVNFIGHIKWAEHVSN